MEMRAFELSEVHCRACTHPQEASQRGTPCTACGATSFRVKIQRSPSGWDVQGIEDVLQRGLFNGGDLTGALISEVLDDGGPTVFFSTRSSVDCDDVSADELSLFLRSSLEGRHHLYVAWKKRELLNRGVGRNDLVPALHDGVQAPWE
ncbi:MAG TPA: hypothetical protein VE981_12780 [Planctomycetota bacterium]|nr:hypothetical protein [Planctomycetota bacterium]